MSQILKNLPKNILIMALLSFAVALGGYLLQNLILFVVSLIVMMVVIYHLSQSVLAEKKLNARIQEQLKESFKHATIGELCSGISHELNNPLAIIIGRAEILLSQIEEGPVEESLLKKSITKINETAARISKIITSMRKISRSTKLADVESQGLYSVMEDIQHLSAERLRKSLIILDLSGIDQDHHVLANYSHLAQVFMFILNSFIEDLKNESEENRTVFFKSQVLNGVTTLCINRCGINQETDLGLSIASDLMVKMGGSLNLTSQNHLTVFNLHFSK